MSRFHPVTEPQISFGPHELLRGGSASHGNTGAHIRNKADDRYMLHMSYQKLHIWRKAMALATDIYAGTRSFPATERFGLVSQMRRAAVSVASNIAEGSQRVSDREFANFILIARGSLAELETQTLVSEKLGFLNDALAKSLLQRTDELSRMLHSFRSKLTAHRP